MSLGHLIGALLGLNRDQSQSPAAVFSQPNPDYSINVADPYGGGLPPASITVGGLAGRGGPSMTAPGIQTQSVPVPQPQAQPQAQPQPQGRPDWAPEDFKPKHGLARLIAGIEDALGGFGQDRYIDKEHRYYISQAMAHMQDDPERALGVIARYNPQLAEQIMMNNNMMNYRLAGLGIRSDKAQADIEAKQTMARAKQYGMAGQLLGAANESTYGPMRDRLVSQNPELDDVLPKTWDPNGVASARDWLGQSVNQALGIPIRQQQADAATVTAGARKQQADTAASIAPSTINRNNAQASTAPSAIARNNAAARSSNASADRAYGINGTVQTGTKPGASAPANSTPPADPKQYAGKTVTFSNGTTWHSDGTTWTKK